MPTSNTPLSLSAAILAALRAKGFRPSEGENPAQLLFRNEDDDLALRVGPAGLETEKAYCDFRQGSLCVAVFQECPGTEGADCYEHDGDVEWLSRARCGDFADALVRQCLATDLPDLQRSIDYGMELTATCAEA